MLGRCCTCVVIALLAGACSSSAPAVFAPPPTAADSPAGAAGSNAAPHAIAGASGAGRAGTAVSGASGAAGVAAQPVLGAGSGSAGSAAAGTVAPPPGTSADSADALRKLDGYLAMPRANRPELGLQPFAAMPLGKLDAEHAAQRLWDDFAKFVRDSRMAEVGASESVVRSIPGDKYALRYYLARRGDNPPGGRSLFISMHGGGNAGASTNDSQWKNQLVLVDDYKPKDAVWVAPRAPIDDWNMWFVEGIDALFDRLITDMIVFEGIDPNKVYLTGYSAGGDGVYQLGPRMAERWAGAGMSAGHPNSASPLSLRNLAFAIHVGGDDTAYDRNKKAEEWGKRLEMLAAADPGGYVNQWQVHAGLPHWMNMEDAVSVPFLQSHARDPIPKKIVWEQADITRAHAYWLAVDAANQIRGSLIEASYDAQGVNLSMVKGVKGITIRLSDAMLNLDAPVRVMAGASQLFAGPATRTIAVLARTLEERGDPALMFCSELTVQIP